MKCINDPETLAGVKRAFGNIIYDADMRIIYKQQASIATSTSNSGQTPLSVEESTEQSGLSYVDQLLRMWLI